MLLVRTKWHKLNWSSLKNRESRYFLNLFRWIHMCHLLTGMPSCYMCDTVCHMSGWNLESFYLNRDQKLNVNTRIKYEYRSINYIHNQNLSERAKSLYTRISRFFKKSPGRRSYLRSTYFFNADSESPHMT